MAKTLLSRVRESVLARGPLCGGIDPSREMLARWGLDDSVASLEYCSLTWLEALVKVTGIVKPQVAYFERAGSQGMAVLERVIREAHAAGVLVIADAKRADVASSNEGYAQAWLEDASSLAVEALTVHPYMGTESLAPLTEVAAASGRGLFVLAATSNPEGQALQSAEFHDGRTVRQSVVDDVRRLNVVYSGTLGVVVGATIAVDIDLAALGGPILVPGVGAQGARADDVTRYFKGALAQSVVVNVSRSIGEQGANIGELYDAASHWRDELAGAL